VELGLNVSIEKSLRDIADNACAKNSVEGNENFEITSKESFVFHQPVSSFVGTHL